MPVSVSGIDRYGNPFRQTARVVNVSRSGACLEGIACLRAPGDVLQLQYRGKKARYRIVWIFEPRLRAGMRCLERDKYIWGLALPLDKVEHVEPAPAPAEPEQSAPPAAAESPSKPANPPAQGGQRRKHPRFTCMGGATVQSPARVVWGRVTVISLSGCYIETASPLRTGTEVQLLLGACGLTLSAKGVVRCFQPNLGMGVKFSEMPEENRRQLASLVAEVASYSLRRADWRSS